MTTSRSTLLGSGSYSIVVIHPTSSSKAVKYFCDQVDDPTAQPIYSTHLESTLELDTQFRLSSPHLVPAVELVDGRDADLKDRFAGIGVTMPRLQPLDSLLSQSLSFQAKLRIAQQLAQGVSDLHRASILHLDIKPSNCLWCSDSNSDFSVKLTDFGLSYVCENIESGVYSVAVRGSLGYRPTDCMLLSLPPSQSDAEPADPQSPYHYTDRFDVWSLGMLFLYILGYKSHLILPVINASYNSTRAKYRGLLCCGDRESRLRRILVDYQVPDYCVAELGTLLSGMLSPQPLNRPSIDEVLKSNLFNPDLRSRLQIRAPCLVPELSYSTHRRSGLKYLIDSYRGPYRQLYIRDLFLSLDIYLRLSQVTDHDLSLTETVVLCQLALRLTLTYYYPYTQLPHELSTREVLEFEFAAIRSLEGITNRPTPYESLDSLSSAQTYLRRLLSHPQVLELYFAQTTQSRQASTAPLHGLSCSLLFSS